jgi:hypothetical protein
MMNKTPKEWSHELVQLDLGTSVLHNTYRFTAAGRGRQLVCVCFVYPPEYSLVSKVIMASQICFRLSGLG